MIAQSVAALVIGYLPGALLFRLPAWNRARRASLAAEERVFWAVVLSVTWSVMVTIGLAGLDAYSFERLLSVNGVVAGLIALGGRHHLLYRGEAARLTWAAVVPAAVIVAGLWQLLPPAEYVIGGRDPGVYINEGIRIAQRGGLTYRDPVVASVPQPFRDLFFPKGPIPEYYSVRFMGFYILDPATGSVVSQFPHGFPASIALGYGLNGLSGARQTVVFWSMLGVVAVYLTGVRVFGRLAAAAATALLVVHVTEFWWGRSPNVEVASRALLFGSLLAFSRAADGDRPFFGAVAGALAGLSLFFRYDAILTVGAIVAAAVLVVAHRQRPGWAFWGSLAATSAAGLWYLLVPMAAYSTPYVSFTRDEGSLFLGAAGLAGAAAFALLHRERWAALARTAVPWLLAIGVVGLACYAYFVRQPGGRLAEHDAMALRVFAWYVTPVGLLAAVVGLGVSLVRHFWMAPAVFMTIVVHGVFFFYKTRIVPEHFWASRRFLTVLMPAAALAIAALVTWVCDPRRWERAVARLRGRPPAPAAGAWRPVLHVALVALALVPLVRSYVRSTDAIRDHVEYAGVIQRIEALSAEVSDRDLLLVESRDRGSDMHVLALPLAYIYDRQVLVLHRTTPDRTALADFVRWALGRHDRVLFLGGSGTALLSRTLQARPLSGNHFWVPEYDSPLNEYPDAVRLKQFDYGLYQLEIGTRAAGGAIDISVGRSDALFVLNFFTPERHGGSGEMFRWSRDSSDVLLMGFSETSAEVEVWMSHGGRPASGPPPEATVSLGGVVLGRVLVGGELRPYRFAVPGALASTLASLDDPAVLRIESSTWVPRELLGVDDQRSLGLMVSRVLVR